ncbi:MAG: glycosyltransferase, partial [bacterium]|nr:glycosyltransferase [bacterium]
MKRRWCEEGGRCVMVCGGGTGGHITPALALCEAWRERVGEIDLWYVGRDGSLEERLARLAGVRFRG